MQDQSLNFFIKKISNEFQASLNAMDSDQLNAAADLISAALKTNNRVHVTGIGKPSHVAEYISALLSSTGTPSYFLDATEAVHGSAGQVVLGDVVILISNSGQTEELKNTLRSLKKLSVKTIAVTGNQESWLAQNTDVSLLAKVNHEGDRYNKPPRGSVLVETLVLQCLSVVLQERNKLSLEQYHLWHPGGTLGASIEAKEE